MKSFLIFSFLSLFANVLPGNYNPALPTVCRPLGTAAHEFHVSQCEIDYNTREQALQITLHIFLDDLELSMKNQGAGELFLCTEKETETAEKELIDYLRRNFKINLDKGEEIKYNWIGKEISEDLAGVWCYVEIPNITTMQQLDVTNTIIFDIHADQKNIVQIKGAPRSGYFMLMKGKEKESLIF